MTAQQLPPRRQWRVRMRTDQQLRTLDAKGQHKRRAVTVTGTVTAVFPGSSMAVVLFDGTWRFGSVAGCSLLVDLDHTERAPRDSRG